MSEQMTPLPEGNSMAQGHPVSAGPRSSWPSVLGIIGIIWASFGMLCNLGGLSNIGYVSLAYVIVSLLAGFAMGLWLLFGSISLLRRKPSSRSTLVSWSIVEIVLIIVLGIWGLGFIDQITGMVVESQMGNPQSQFGNTENLSKEELTQIIEVTVYGFSGCSIVLSMIWPVLLLIFLNTQGRRREIDSWTSREPEGFSNA
jgi:hypothetical protein